MLVGVLIFPLIVHRSNNECCCCFMSRHFVLDEGVLTARLANSNLTVIMKDETQRGMEIENGASFVFCLPHGLRFPCKNHNIVI